VILLGDNPAADNDNVLTPGCAQRLDQRRQQGLVPGGQRRHADDVSASLDRLRRRKPETEFEEYQAVEEHGPMAGAQQGELGQWLKSAIAGLREPYRSLVVLRDIQQHSYDEVANATELSLSQVKVYLHRARKQLREQLAEVRP